MRFYICLTDSDKNLFLYFQGRASGENGIMLVKICNFTFLSYSVNPYRKSIKNVIVCILRDPFYIHTNKYFDLLAMFSTKLQSRYFDDRHECVSFVQIRTRCLYMDQCQLGANRKFNYKRRWIHVMGTRPLSVLTVLRLFFHSCLKAKPSRSSSSYTKNCKKESKIKKKHNPRIL